MRPLALALFCAALLPVSHADPLPPVEIIDSIEGEWAMELSAEQADKPAFACNQMFVRIWIEIEDGAPQYRSQYMNSGVEEPLFKSSINVRYDQHGREFPLIELQYENEDRVTEDGAPVKWWLIMVDKDQFVWRRSDLEGYSHPRFRCPRRQPIG